MNGKLRRSVVPIVQVYFCATVSIHVFLISNVEFFYKLNSYGFVRVTMH